MANSFLNSAAVCVAAAFLFAHSPHVATAHPGHGDTPDFSGAVADCSRCGDNDEAGTSAAAQSKSDGNSGSGVYDQSKDLATDVQDLMSKSQAVQAKIADVETRVAKAHDAFDETGKLAASSRRQVLRAMRSARRANQRLVKDLSTFVDRYSDRFTSETRAQLEADLTSLKAHAGFLSGQEDMLKRAKGCTGNQCDEVFEMLERVKWSVGGTDIGLSKALATVGAVETQVDDSL
jgi:hypothetical protein